MMKENINSFSLRRVWMLMRWDFGMNWKSYAWRYLTIFFIYFVFIWITTHKAIGFTPVDFFASYLLMVIFGASFIVAPVKNKESCLFFLVLPASNIEKFLYRTLFGTVFYMIALWVLISLADVSQYLVRQLFFSDSDVSHPFLYELFSIGMPLVLWLEFFLVQALSVLGGFSKWLFAIVMFVIIRYGVVTFSWFERAAMEEPFGVNSLLVCLIIFCWWMAYRLFSRRQIV
ncbi:MAG: hypothetical protein IKU98_03865 [Bacteroidaceae bacterium]|nr:hypothetical protein [Bacteroidaceae bacterium]